MNLRDCRNHAGAERGETRSRSGAPQRFEVASRCGGAPWGETAFRLYLSVRPRCSMEKKDGAAAGGFVRCCMGIPEALSVCWFEGVEAGVIGGGQRCRFSFGRGWLRRAESL